MKNLKYFYGCRQVCLPLNRLILSTIIALIVSLQVSGQVHIRGLAPVQTPVGGMAIDGDVYANTGVAGQGDWFVGNVSGSGGGIFGTASPNAPLYTLAFSQIDMWGEKDSTSFLLSNKINDNPNTYLWGLGNVPNKNEIHNAKVHFSYGDPGLPGGNANDLWIMFMADREVTEGSSYIDFELLQKKLTKNADGTFTSLGTQNGRTVNDLLITIQFENGGAEAIAVIHSWQAVGNSYAWVEKTTGLTGNVLITENSAAINIPYNAYGLTSYVINQWAEGAVNLSQILGLGGDPCYAISTLFVRTRTSGNSSQSELMDFPGGQIQLDISLDDLAVQCPGNVNLPACTPYADIVTAYNAWKAGFTYTGGIGTIVTNIGTLPTLPLNVACAGISIDFDYLVSDQCIIDGLTCNSKFIVAPDIQLPVIVDPADITLEGCNTNWPTAVSTTWTDNCSTGGTIQGVAGDPVTDGCSQYRIYTFNVSDACGNAALPVTVRVTRVYDMTLPVIVDPLDITLEGCNPNWPATVSTTWTDNCSTGGTIQGVAGDPVNDGCSQYRIYTFNVSDACGNAALPVTVRVTRVYDMTLPVIVDPLDITLEGCNPNWPTAVSTTWSDNCSTGGTIQGVAGDPVSDGCSQYRIYTFNVSDACGNAALPVTVRVTRVYDMTLPVIVDPLDITLEGCNPNWPTAVSTTWSDNCSTGGTIQGVAGDPVSDGCSQYRIYTFNVSDACGNAALPVTVRVTRVYDLTLPVIVDPADITLTGCNPAWPTAVQTTWTDNCSTGGTINGVASAPVTVGCTEYKDYTFNVNDACGNAALPVIVRVTRTYDVTVPVIVDPADITLTGCNPAWPTAVQTTWTDNCSSGGTINGVPGNPVTVGCTEYKDYTFNVSDACGNAAIPVVVRVTRTYDVTLPVIVDPTDIILTGCNPAWPATVSTTWTDNCSAGGTINGVAGTPVTEGCTQYKDYTFNVNDACGNAALPVVVRVTRTYDETKPVIVEPADYTLSGCNPAWPTVVQTTWTDNCSSGGTINGLAGTVGTNGCIEYIDYTFNVNDACGNAALPVVVRVSRIYDLTGPVLYSDLEDLTFNCAEDVVIPSPTYIDGCGGTVEVFCSITGYQGVDCSEFEFPIGETEVCFKAKDACGNLSDVTCITITVEPCDEFCSLTQGYYGNPGGLYCTGETTFQLLQRLLSTPLILGSTANNRSFTLVSGNEQIIIDILPGGGTSTVLAKNYTSTNYKELVDKKKGTITNTLLAQTLTLGLNLRLGTTDLGSLVFTSPNFATYGSTDCGGEDSHPVTEDVKYFTIPITIMNYFGGDPSVLEIYTLANQVLGKVVTNVRLDDIAKAVNVINDALDECRYIVFLPYVKSSEITEAAIVAPAKVDNVTLKVAPNPFRGNTEIKYSVASDSRVVLEVYTMQGVKVATLFDGQASAGLTYTYNYSPRSSDGQQTYHVVLRTMYGIQSRQIIRTH